MSSQISQISNALRCNRSEGVFLVYREMGNSRGITPIFSREKILLPGLSISKIKNYFDGYLIYPELFNRPLVCLFVERNGHKLRYILK